MKPSIAISTICLFLGVSVLNALSLSWDKTEAKIDLGPDQEEARATFTVTNEGDEPVRIARIRTSCGCTGSIVDRKIINSGESTEIVGTFKKGKRRGLNRNKLQVYVDSQPDPVATLQMIVRIPELAKINPQIVYWSQQSPQNPRSVQITLDERYLNEITSIDYDQSVINVERVDEGDDSSSATLMISPKDYTKQYRGAVTVTAKGPEGRVIENKIHTFVQP